MFYISVCRKMLDRGRAAPDFFWGASMLQPLKINDLE
jgi:type IV secretory pathway VirB3-like protein